MDDVDKQVAVNAKAKDFKKCPVCDTEVKKRAQKCPTCNKTFALIRSEIEEATTTSHPQVTHHRKRQSGKNNLLFFMTNVLYKVTKNWLNL